MTAPAATPRSEPLLWLQLLGLGVLPLEALLLLLLLAGNDPGPLPGLERVLCWSLGALAPGVLLWRQPADVWSLLLVQTPLRGRRDLQRRLSSLQEALAPRLGLVLGVGLALPLLWWLDGISAFASDFSPVGGSPRLLGLLLGALVLAVMLWQWQQLLQSLWLLSRGPAAIAAAAPMASVALEERRLCLGLPLLLPDPLQSIPAPARPRPATPEAPVPGGSGSLAAEAGTSPEPPGEPLEPPAGEPAQEPPEPDEGPTPKDGVEQLKDVVEADAVAEPTPATDPGPEATTSGGEVAVAIEPEQRTEEGEGPALDQQIP